MSFSRLSFFFILSLAIFAESKAQSEILDAYVQEAIQNNLSLKNEDLAKTQQENRVLQAKKLWGPQADFSANYLLAEGGRIINFPIGDLFNPTYATLNQLTGSNQFPTDLKNEEIQLTPNNFIDLQLVVSQPIINSSIKYNQKIQSELVRLNDLNRTLGEQDIALQVKSAYYNYLKTFKGEEILEESAQLLEDVLAFNKKLVKFNKATDEIIYDVEYQIENLKSQKINLNEQRILSQSLFNLLLNRDFSEEIKVDSTILAGLNTDLESPDNYLTTALQNRTEFKQLDLAQLINELNRERIKKEALPTFGVQGAVGLQTENFSLDLGGPLFTLGFGAQVNLFDNGLRKTRQEELLIELKRTENQRAQLQQKTEIEIAQAYYALQSLNAKMQSDAAAAYSAERSLKRLKVRYENDKALLIELLQAQNRLTNARLSQVLTQYDYLAKTAELEKVCGGL